MQSYLFKTGEKVGLILGASAKVDSFRGRKDFCSVLIFSLNKSHGPALARVKSEAGAASKELKKTVEAAQPTGEEQLKIIEVTTTQATLWDLKSVCSKILGPNLEYFFMRFFFVFVQVPLINLEEI